MPAGLAVLAVELDRRAVGRIGLRAPASTDSIAALASSVGGRRRLSLRGREGQQHVAGILRRRIAVHADHRELRPPGAVQHQLGPLVGHRLRRAGEGELGVDRVAQHLGRLLGLLDALRRDLHIEVLQLDRAGGLVLEPRQEHARSQAEGRGHDPRRVARMHALGQHSHRQRAGRDAAQRGRQPQPVVVAAARVEADHQRGVADAVRQMVDVVGQVVAARLLAGLDHHDAARARQLLLLQRLQRGQAGIDRIAVVGAAAAVELVALAAPASTGPGPPTSPSSPAACRDGRRAAPCRRCRPAGR